MRRRCELCEQGIGLSYRVNGVRWRLCLGCVADFRVEGKRVIPDRLADPWIERKENARSKPARQAA